MSESVIEKTFSCRTVVNWSRVDPETWSRHGTGQFNRLYSSVIDWSKANEARHQRIDELDDVNNSASTPRGLRQLKINGDENKQGNDRNKTTAPGKFSYKLYLWSAISLYLVAVTAQFIFCHCCIRLCVLRTVIFTDTCMHLKCLRIPGITSLSCDKV